MKTLELIHCYQHLLANPAKIRWARLCTHFLRSACDVCLVSIHSPPTSLKKLLGIRWLLVNTDHHEYWMTHLPLLCPLLVHLLTILSLYFPANFLNVLGNCCSGVPSHFHLCPHPLFPSPLFSLVNHLSLPPLLP